MGQKISILVRDDDISAFTQPEILQRVHEPLLKRNLPLNLAVIPQVRTDIRGGALERIYFSQEGLEFEPFIPPLKRGLGESYGLKYNLALCTFLRQAPNIEVLQHGFAHTWEGGNAEFLHKNKNLLQQWLNKGKALITEALEKEIQFFVPPWDVISQEAAGFIRKSHLGISLKEPPRFFLPLWRRFNIKHSRISSRFLWSGRLLLLGHPGYIISRFNSAEYMYAKIKELLNKEDIIVLVVHHWEFFFDWAEEDSKFLLCWHKILEELISNPDIEFLTFTQLYKRLKER